MDENYIKQLSLIDIPETIPQFTAQERDKFEEIKAISSEDIMVISQDEPEPQFTPDPEWDAQWFRGSWWVQWSPILSVFHPRTGNGIMFNADDEDLPEVADKISEILS
jgi:hypothetical protein